MDKEIEVGEYVKLKDGTIFKIDENTTNYYNSNKKFITNEIAKHSSNIIDLIEVGDYVNGYYVEKVWEQVNYRMAIDLRGSYLGLSDDKFIKSIVTKEQFKSIEYTIHEREEKENG